MPTTVIEKEGLAELAEEFDERDLSNLCFACEQRLFRHSPPDGAKIHKISTYRQICLDTMNLAESGIIRAKTLGDLKFEDSRKYRQHLKILHFIRHQLNNSFY